jgi:hypothetical protein
MTDDLFGQNQSHDERALLDAQLTDSKLYHTTKDYKDLLDFVVRLRNFAPFNAMLLQIQKPGLTYAASRVDWWMRFQRRPKEGAWPLLILWPFGPVALVYDVLDTEGNALPNGVAAFVAYGPITGQYITTYLSRAAAKNIRTNEIDAGDGRAGSIRCEQGAASAKGKELVSDAVEPQPYASRSFRDDCT